MKRITKEQFVKYINKIKRYFDANADIDEFLVKYKDIFCDSSIYITEPIFETMDVLSLALGIDPYEDDIIIWWCCECGFGEVCPDDAIKLDGDDVPDQYKLPELKTAEDLYDFCIWYADYIDKDLENNDVQ